MSLQLVYFASLPVWHTDLGHNHVDRKYMRCYWLLLLLVFTPNLEYTLVRGLERITNNEV